jgi:hypothetical protein
MGDVRQVGNVVSCVEERMLGATHTTLELATSTLDKASDWKCVMYLVIATAVDNWLQNFAMTALRTIMHRIKANFYRNIPANYTSKII